MEVHALTEVEGTDSIDERDVHALIEYLTVLPEAPDLYEVVSQSGKVYTVDAREGGCSCPDHEHRGVECKHLRRVAFAIDARPIPEGVDPDTIDDNLGEHVDGGPNVGNPLAADGGLVRRERGERTRVPVAGGVLVYEQQDVGRELVGFEDVEDWPDLRSALAARGHNIGAIHYLPVLDGST